MNDDYNIMVLRKTGSDIGKWEQAKQQEDELQP